MLRHLRYLPGQLFRAATNLGPVNTARYVGQRTQTLLGLGAATFQLRTPDARFPIVIRRGTSDIQVFKQIFIDREYGCLDELDEVGLVIDCGANIGCSAAYFLTRFPRCHVIAIEPDAENYRLLRENMGPYGDRVECHRAGVWSHATGLVMQETKTQRTEEWGRQVRECRTGETAAFHAVDIATLLAGSGCQRISLLKIDVEGAEVVIFSEDCHAWLGRVDNLVIELHSGPAYGDGPAAFQRAIKPHRFTISHSGELTVCRQALDLT